MSEPDFQVWLTEAVTDDDKDEIAKAIIEAVEAFGVDYTFQGKNVVV